MRAEKEGKRVSRHPTRRRVGIGSSWQVLGADFKMKLLTVAGKCRGRYAVKWICHRQRDGAYGLRFKFASNFDDFYILFFKKEVHREQFWEIRQWEASREMS